MKCSAKFPQQTFQLKFGQRPNFSTSTWIDSERYLSRFPGGNIAQSYYLSESWFEILLTSRNTGVTQDKICDNMILGI